VQLTADIIEAFAGVFLSPMYDDTKPTPRFHREGWRLYCSRHPQCAIAAPREHGKSMAFTHNYILASALFRAHQYIVLVSSTEEMAIEHLGDISKELHENEDLAREFHIAGFDVDQKTDIVCRCTDGYRFRIIARGSGQKMRGRKWMGKRPSLIVCDDLEDDEQVENRESRIKFRRWFLRALRPALRDGGVIRVHGTILHEDSLLNRLVHPKGSESGTWRTLLYKAHTSFDDFSNILWPEKFPEARLRAIRQGFIEQQDALGYSQEYLNDPFDNEEAYLRRDDFLPMEEEDYAAEKLICVGVDLAISKADSANRTSFTIGGKCARNLVHIIDQRLGRMDSLEIIEEFFSIQAAWRPEMFFVEDGQIWKAIKPILTREMQKRDIWLSLTAIPPIRDKAARGRSYQRRHRAHGMRFDKCASWYDAYEYENLRFTGRGEAIADDQFDSTALLSKGFDLLPELETEDLSDVEDDIPAFGRADLGRSLVTGY
jgi:hypothetical protein